MSTERLSSTGRTPALAPADVQRLLTRYFAEDKPSIKQLAEEFSQTNSKNETRALSLATVRKYLKHAGVVLPRGRANDLPRKPQNVRTLMNRIPTEVLIGKGRAELLLRRIARGEGVVALAKEFGVSKDRVRRLRDRQVAETAPETPETPVAPEVTEPAPEPVSAPEVPVATAETVEEASEAASTDQPEQTAGNTEA